jgi:DNA-binding LacI/PurR family transcriptional regulator
LALVAVAPGDVASATSPTVTSADVPADQLGREAVAMLIKAIDGTARMPQAHLVRPPFTDRGSVVALRTSAKNGRC